MTPCDPQRIADTLRSHAYRFSNERELQEGIAKALSAAGIEYAREVSLDAHSRIDFMIPGGIGIEVKIDGPTSSVIRQMARYAQFDSVSAMILVTSRVRHGIDWNAPLNGKRVLLVLLETAFA